MPWPELILVAVIVATVSVPLEIMVYVLGAEVIVGFMYLLWCIVRDHARAARRGRRKEPLLALCTCSVRGRRGMCAWCGGRP